MIPYSIFLLLSGIVFTMAERVWPRQAQPVARLGYGGDVLYAVFNSEIVGSLVAIWLGGLYAGTDFLALRALLGLNTLAQQSDAVQILALLTAKDFLQW